MNEIYDSWRQFTGIDDTGFEEAEKRALEFFTAENLAGD